MYLSVGTCIVKGAIGVNRPRFGLEQQQLDTVTAVINEVGTVADLKFESKPIHNIRCGVLVDIATSTTSECSQ